jgi:hypothetical protein
MIEMHKAGDLYLKQEQDWVRELTDERNQDSTTTEEHQNFILQMILYLFNH